MNAIGPVLLIIILLSVFSIEAEIIDEYDVTIKGRVMVDGYEYKCEPTEKTKKIKDLERQIEEVDK